MPTETLAAELRTLRDSIEAKHRDVKTLGATGRQTLYYEQMLWREKFCQLHAARCQEQTERFAQRLSLAALNRLSPPASVAAAASRAKPAPAKETR